METIYHGYPQTLELKPYMVYRTEEKSPQPEGYDRVRRQAESEYFKGLYPLAVRRCQRLVEACCDRLDYPGSPIYDEYPDREVLCRLCDEVLKNAREQGMEENRDLIQLLLLYEISRRREQKRE